MSTLQILFYYLDKELPKELILKILFKCGGLEHPLIKHIKYKTRIHKYTNQYNHIKRPFGKLWYNFKDITERQRRILGLKDNYGDSIWTLINCNLDRSYEILYNKLRCYKCDFPYWIRNSYYSLNNFDMYIKKKYINHINYGSYTKYILLLENILGMDFNKKFICKDCINKNENLKNIQIVYNKLNITHNLTANHYPTHYKF